MTFQHFDPMHAQFNPDCSHLFTSVLHVCYSITSSPSLKKFMLSSSKVKDREGSVCQETVQLAVPGVGAIVPAEQGENKVTKD